MCVGRLFDQNLIHNEIDAAAELSPDLRVELLNDIVNANFMGETKSAINVNKLPYWLTSASVQNYFDEIALEALRKVMKSASEIQNLKNGLETIEELEGGKEQSYVESESDSSSSSMETEIIDKPTLCIYCRSPSEFLCPSCNGAYFCPPPRNCTEEGWSHKCLCLTWDQYVNHRNALSTFPFTWHDHLMTRIFQISEKPYEIFLKELGIYRKGWWITETRGWAGGLGGSARLVDAETKSYEEGFALDKSFIPLQCHVDDQDSGGRKSATFDRDPLGLYILDSWSDYYKLRDIPLTSPAALILTFPLSIYFSIQKYGEVPLTVAKMLNRPMRVHVVGIEKELNFLDVFSEVGYLLPKDILIEMIFVCREDMIPPKCSHVFGGRHKYDLTANLSLELVAGTYNDGLDPLFDCGSGGPDMVIGLNAGLFAYKSWRSVVEFITSSEGVVGVFTDYNEHSGTNCASLGGEKARESLIINPFRQPRAMPVNCMNLPQFSNGFIYVFNEQVLD